MFFNSYILATKGLISLFSILFIKFGNTSSSSIEPKSFRASDFEDDLIAITFAPLALAS